MSTWEHPDTPVYLRGRRDGIEIERARIEHDVRALTYEIDYTGRLAPKGTVLVALADVEDAIKDAPPTPRLVGHKAEQHAAQVASEYAPGDAEITRDQALEQRDRARALACRLEEELALIRRAGRSRRIG